MEEILFTVKIQIGFEKAFNCTTDPNNEKKSSYKTNDQGKSKLYDNVY